MGLFGGREPESSVSRRFRSGVDRFAFTHEGDHYSALISANAERVADLFHALTAQLPPAVDVVVADLRTDSTWRGVNVPLNDVREAFLRLKVPIAQHGGVEFAVFTPEDQVTLTPHLELYVYSRSVRWLYTLQGLGLEQDDQLTGKSWRAERGQLAAAPELVEALAATAARLALLPDA